MQEIFPLNNVEIVSASKPLVLQGKQSDRSKQKHYDFFLSDDSFTNTIMPQAAGY